MCIAQQSGRTAKDGAVAPRWKSPAPVVQLVKGHQKAKPSILNALLLKAALIVEKIDVCKAVSWQCPSTGHEAEAEQVMASRAAAF